MAIDNRPEPMSSPINNPAESRQAFKPEMPLPDYDAAVADGDDV